MMKKRLAYDDDELVELIAEGQLTYRAIGQRVGISEELVKKIAQGRRRKDLARRLWDTEAGVLAEARRIGTRYARSLIMEQVRLGLTGEGEPARRAREFVLKFTMMARPRKGELPEDRKRRSEQELQDCRAIGIVPWEDELDAEMARDAAADEKAVGEREGGRELTAPPAVSSMAAVAVMPAGPGNPALTSAR